MKKVVTLELDKHNKEYILNLLKNEGIVVKSRNKSSILLNNNVLLIFKKFNPNRANDLLKYKNDKIFVDIINDINEEKVKELESRLKENITINRSYDRLHDILPFVSEEHIVRDVYKITNDYNIITLKTYYKNLPYNTYETLEEAKNNLLNLLNKCIELNKKTICRYEDFVENKKKEVSKLIKERDRILNL